MKCVGCDCEGELIGTVVNTDQAFQITVEPPVPIEHDNAGLFEYCTEYYCFPCLCKTCNTCFGCLETTPTLYKDVRCNSKPYVCVECRDSSRRVHTWKCYGDGCMTPEEVAQEEFEMLSGD